MAYLAHGAAVGKAGCGQPHDLAGRFIAGHVEVVLQRRVLRAMEIHKLRVLVHPDLQTGAP